MIILRGLEAHIYLFLKGMYKVGASIIFSLKEWDYTLNVFLLAVCTLILYLSIVFKHEFVAYNFVVLVAACLVDLFYLLSRENQL